MSTFNRKLQSNFILIDLIYNSELSLPSRIQSAKSQMIPLRSLNNLTGTKHFTDLEIEGDWSVHVMDVEGLVNDVNISAWSIDTLFKTGNTALHQVNWTKHDQDFLSRKRPADRISEKNQ